jgi:hypothetical protein
MMMFVREFSAVLTLSKRVMQWFTGHPMPQLSVLPLYCSLFQTASNRSTMTALTSTSLEIATYLVLIGKMPL